MNSISLRIRINDRHTLEIEGDPETFGDLLAYAGQNLDAIKAAYTKLEGEIRAPQGAPVSSSPHAPANPAAAPAGEIGPVGIAGIVTATTNKDGVALKSAKHTVNFTNGKKFSTFDASLAQSAKTLWVEGKTVYYTTSMNGTYENLASVRSAQGMP